MRVVSQNENRSGIMAATPVEWKGDAKVFDGVTMQMYPVGCFEYGCASCCSNALFCSLTCGTHLCTPPTFTFHIAEDGMSGYGGEATFAGCFPMSPIPCFNGCGFGPLAFVSPFKFEEVEGTPGALKWVGNGQVRNHTTSRIRWKWAADACSSQAVGWHCFAPLTRPAFEPLPCGQVCKGGMCPCINNKGDYGINDANGDGSTPEKAHQAYPVSMFWPPCVNGACPSALARDALMTPSDGAHHTRILDDALRWRTQSSHSDQSPHSARTPSDGVPGARTLRPAAACPQRCLHHRRVRCMCYSPHLRRVRCVCYAGTCCGKGVPAFRLTQKGVGPPNVPKGVTMTRGD